MQYFIFVLFVMTADPSKFMIGLEEDYSFETAEACEQFIETSPGIEEQRMQWNTPKVKASWGCLSAAELMDFGLQPTGQELL